MPAVLLQRAFVPGGHHPLAGPSPRRVSPYLPARLRHASSSAGSSFRAPRSELVSDGSAQGSRTTAPLPRLRGCPSPGLIINPEAE